MNLVPRCTVCKLRGLRTSLAPSSPLTSTTSGSDHFLSHMLHSFLHSSLGVNKLLYFLGNRTYTVCKHKLTHNKPWIYRPFLGSHSKRESEEEGGGGGEPFAWYQLLLKVTIIYHEHYMELLWLHSLLMFLNLFYTKISNKCSISVTYSKPAHNCMCYILLCFAPWHCSSVAVTAHKAIC